MSTTLSSPGGLTSLFKNAVLVKTTKDSPTVGLIGTNGVEVLLSVEPSSETSTVEEFIEFLKVTCTDPQTLYQIPLGGDAQLHIPGSSVPAIVRGLREVRDDGRKLESYSRII